ncbi:MAG: ribonuclease PH [Verrucomicrobiales bacterium]
MILRADGRAAGALRPITWEFDPAPHAQGSVIIGFGNTRVLCAAMIEEGVPPWMKAQGVSGGWLTAEYSMLPYSTHGRKARDSARGKVDGRSVEIQRLIGRALRAVVNLETLGPRTLWVDCDVIQADGGTRTASITGAAVAVKMAVHRLRALGKLKADPVSKWVAAVSVGVVQEEVLVDLNYSEDKEAAVDMNLVMTDDQRFVEVQGSGEESTFSAGELQGMLQLGAEGIQALIAKQQTALAAWQKTLG